MRGIPDDGGAAAAVCSRGTICGGASKSYDKLSVGKDRGCYSCNEFPDPWWALLLRGSYEKSPHYIRAHGITSRPLNASAPLPSDIMVN